MNAAVWPALAAVAAGSVAGWATAPWVAHYAEESLDETTRLGRLSSAILTALVCGAVGWRFGHEPVLAAVLYLGIVGSLLILIDLAVHRLPDPFTLPSYGIGFTLLALAVPFTDDGPRRLGHAVIGMAALWLFYLVQALARAGMGWGDVKLAGVLGLYLGWFGPAVWWTAVLATIALGGLAGLSVMIAKRSLRGRIAFGPYMLWGAMVALLLAA